MLWLLPLEFPFEAKRDADHQWYHAKVYVRELALTQHRPHDNVPLGRPITRTTFPFGDVLPLVVLRSSIAQ